jgi:hypothetical protein
MYAAKGCEKYAELFTCLEGATVESIIAVPDGFGGGPILGLTFRLKDGTPMAGWVQSDAEGNGPGFLSLTTEGLEGK